MAEPTVAEPTVADVDALVGPATPHFAYQLRARVQELVAGLPAEHPVRRHAEEKMELLDRLGHASSKANDGGREPRSRPGWDELPSSAPVAISLSRTRDEPRRLVGARHRRHTGDRARNRAPARA